MSFPFDWTSCLSSWGVTTNIWKVSPGLTETKGKYPLTSRLFWHYFIIKTGFWILSLGHPVFIREQLVLRWMLEIVSWMSPSCWTLPVAYEKKITECSCTFVPMLYQSFVLVQQKPEFPPQPSAKSKFKIYRIKFLC